MAGTRPHLGEESCLLACLYLMGAFLVNPTGPTTPAAGTSQCPSLQNSPFTTELKSCKLLPPSRQLNLKGNEIITFKQDHTKNGPRCTGRSEMLSC